MVIFKSSKSFKGSKSLSSFMCTLEIYQRKGCYFHVFNSFLRIKLNKCADAKLEKPFKTVTAGTDVFH